MRTKTTILFLPVIIFAAVLAIAPYPGRADNQTNVAMVGMMFSPANITISRGTAVMWTNQSNLMHTVTADNGMFDSGTINPGGTFMFAFNTPGTFAYYCRFHGGPGGVGMSGTVTVMSASQTNPPPMIMPPPNNPPMPPTNPPPTMNMPMPGQNPPPPYIPPANQNRPLPSYNPPTIRFFTPLHRSFLRIIPRRRFSFRLNLSRRFSAPQPSAPSFPRY